MANTALGAEKEKAIIFISDAHEKFYYEKLKEVRYGNLSFSLQDGFRIFGGGLLQGHRPHPD